VNKILRKEQKEKKETRKESRIERQREKGGIEIKD
jgi:hypothetical protein